MGAEGSRVLRDVRGRFRELGVGGLGELRKLGEEA